MPTEFCAVSGGLVVLALVHSRMSLVDNKDEGCQGSRGRNLIAPWFQGEERLTQFSPAIPEL